MMNIKSIQKENILLSKELCQENQMIYRDFASYLRVSRLRESEQEEVLSDILRLFFDWEKEGRKVAEMIGEDFESFANEIIQAVKHHKTLLQKCKEYVFTLIQALCYMLTIDFLFLYLPKLMRGHTDLIYDFSLAIVVRVLLFFIVMMALFNYIGKNSFRLSSKPLPRSIRFLIGCGAVCFFVTIIFSTSLRTINIVSVQILYIVIILAAFWLYKGLMLLISKNYKASIG